VTDRAPSEARSVLAARLAATAGGDAGLVSAMTAAWSDLDALAPDAREDALAVAARAIRGRTHRDPRGLVLTPPPVARALAALVRAMSPGVRCVLDPCCGTGRLLVPWYGIRRVGIDIDPVILALGRRARPDDVEWRAADGLVVPRPDARAGTLAVVCNPPWVAAYARRSQAASLDVDALRRVVGDWGGRGAHPTTAFVARIVRDLLRPGEVAGFVVPDVLLTGVRHAPLRDALARHVDEARVVRLAPDAFDGVVAHPVLLGVRRSEPRFPPERTSRLASVAFAEGVDFDTWTWTELALDDTWRALAPSEPWVRPTPVTPVLRALVDAPRLGSLVDVHDGVNPGPAAARAALVRETPDDLVAPAPVIEGRDVHPGATAPARLWLESDRTRILPAWRSSGTSLRRPGLFEGPRLFSRQTGGRLTVSYADDASYALNSVHVLRPRDASAVRDGGTGDAPNEARGLRRLMAWLNTPLATELYLAMYAESQASFPQVKVTWLRTLPVPWPLTAHECALADAWAEDLDHTRLRALDGALRRRLGAPTDDGAAR